MFRKSLNEILEDIEYHYILLYRAQIKKDWARVFELQGIISRFEREEEVLKDQVSLRDYQRAIR